MPIDGIHLTPKNITKGLNILRDMKGLKTIGIERSGIIGDAQSAIEDWQIKRDHSYRGILEII